MAMRICRSLTPKELYHSPSFFEEERDCIGSAMVMLEANGIS